VWEKHRDKITTAGGAAGGAILGGLIGGKKGAIIGAITGGAGAAIYTYKIRDKDDF
jgi:outer membrane lipoprotein SlyB